MSPSRPGCHSGEEGEDPGMSPTRPGCQSGESRRGGVMKDWYDGLSSQNLDFLNLEFQNYFKV